MTLYETFRHWSDGGSVWIISDTHFDDEDCKLMNPNWITPKEQVDLINRHVQKNDCLIHLGDVGDPKASLWKESTSSVHIMRTSQALLTALK